MDIEQLREKALKITKGKVKERLEKGDILIVQAVEAMEDLTKCINLLISRLRHFYGIHFPELSKSVRDSDKFLDLVLKYKDRKGFENSEFSEKAKSSVGADLSEKDLEYILSFAKVIDELRREKEGLEKYVDALMDEIAPNIKAVVGSKIGAKLIALAGSLEKLAKFPASTIQVLGAEKALFAHLQKGVKPPKHGIIFQLPWIRKAPKKKRGKIARRIATKVAIAAKIDFFKGEFRGDKLRKELEKEIQEIMRG